MGLAYETTGVLWIMQEQRLKGMTEEKSQAHVFVEFDREQMLIAADYLESVRQYEVSALLRYLATAHTDAPRTGRIATIQQRRNHWERFRNRSETAIRLG